jgi:hypothetical protein
MLFVSATPIKGMITANLIREPDSGPIRNRSSRVPTFHRVFHQVFLMVQQTSDGVQLTHRADCKQPYGRANGAGVLKPSSLVRLEASGTRVIESNHGMGIDRLHWWLVHPK